MFIKPFVVVTQYHNVCARDGYLDKLYSFVAHMVGLGAIKVYVALGEFNLDHIETLPDWPKILPSKNEFGKVASFKVTPWSTVQALNATLLMAREELTIGAYFLTADYTLPPITLKDLDALFEPIEDRLVVGAKFDEDHPGVSRFPDYDISLRLALWNPRQLYTAQFLEGRSLKGNDSPSIERATIGFNYKCVALSFRAFVASVRVPSIVPVRR